MIDLKTRERDWPLTLSHLLMLLVVLNLLVWGQLAVRGDPGSELACAVVMIPSHGTSGVIISSAPGKTLVLTVAHGGDFDRRPRVVIPQAAPAGPPIPANARWVAWDKRADVALIQLDVGPFAGVAPVARAGSDLPRVAISCGYDEMRVPAHLDPAHVVEVDRDGIWTAEKPWHGRSGGPLIDPRTGQVVGLVQGYTGGHSPNPPGRGVYIPLPVLNAFLARAGTSAGTPPLAVLGNGGIRPPGGFNGPPGAS